MIIPVLKNKIMQKLLISICALVLFTSCASSRHAVISNSPKYQHTFKASYELVLDAVLNHLSSQYLIEYIDMPTGTIHAYFKTSTPNSLLDCGNIKDTGTLQSGSPFTYIYNGADTPVYTLAKVDGNYMHDTRTLALEGNIRLVLQRKNKNTTTLRIITHYTLTKQNTYRPMKRVYSNLQALNQANTKKEVMIFYSNEVGKFAITTSVSANVAADTMQCVANTRLEDSIIKNITQHLE